LVYREYFKFGGNIFKFGGNIFEFGGNIFEFGGNLIWRIFTKSAKKKMAI